MTELTFAKSFLATLDSRPIKLQPDYAADLKTLEPKFPYTLSRNSHSMQKLSAQSSSASTATFTAQGQTTSVTLKSLRNPPLDLRLENQALDTSIHALKERVVSELGLAGTDSVKVLYKKRPCANSKTVKDVVGDEGTGQVDFTVLVMEGPSAVEKKEDDVAVGGQVEARTQSRDEVGVAQGESGKKALDTQEFWNDLKGFLVQRLRDEGTAGEVWAKFRGTWKV